MTSIEYSLRGIILLLYHKFFRLFNQEVRDLFGTTADAAYARDLDISGLLPCNISTWVLYWCCNLV